MRTKLLLADSAEVRERLLFLLGGGWDQIGPGPQPFAIAGIVEVDWDEANVQHQIEFSFEDEDGKPFVVPTPGGAQPVKLAAPFEVGRPPGSVRGTTFSLPIAVPLVPLPWTPGRRYCVVVRINGSEVDRLRFSVRPTPQVPLQ